MPLCCQIIFSLILSALFSGVVEGADACADVISDCRSYGQSACVNYADWAKINCAFTCQFCTGTPPPKSCQDNRQDCAKYATDLCTASNYRVWAEDNCSKFCGFCVDTTTPPMTTTTVKQTSLQTTKPALAGPCVDGLSFCLVYSKSSCNDVNWADKYCRKTCNKC